MDDNNPCTDDICDNGTPSHPVKADGTMCDEGNGCTIDDRCIAGICTSGTPVVCPPPDQCHIAGTCDPTTGVCSSPTKPDGTACDDGDACTQADACQDGSCVGDVPFAAPAIYTTSSSVAYQVVASDLNGDGELDLVLSASAMDAAIVLLNQGNGIFAPPVNYPAGVNPESVVAADLNGDGAPDLAVANYVVGPIGEMHVLLNQGDGTFALAVNYAAGTTPTSIAAADLNGDGAPDLAVMNLYGNNMSLFMNQGNGTFAPAINTAATTYPRSVAAWDLNDDGKPDLAVASWDGHIAVLINQGSGTFAPAVEYPAGPGPQSVIAVDLNGDGKLDLAVANPITTTGTVSVLLNQGNGVFAPAVAYPAGAETYSVAAGDLNGDGKPDLAAVNQLDGSVSVFLNKGNGTFTAGVSFYADTAPRAVAAADLNGDGKSDLTVGKPFELKVYLNACLP